MPVLRRKALRIVERLAEAGHVAYFAGGCVRDILRGEKPHDYDIATDATVEEIEAIFPRTIPVGRQFGVVIVVMGGDQFEVATFRGEGEYSDGRHPDEVHPADPREDALRRDFTINALFYDPREDKVIDYVGSERDIREGLVRAVGDPDQRFAEDKLRMMRAVRFAARFDYRIEEATFQAILRHAPEIKAVSAERLRDELSRILTGPGRGRGLELLRETTLLGQVLPEVEQMHGVPQPGAFHPEGDVFTHTCRTLDALNEPSVVLAFGALLHDVGKPHTITHTDRIRFNLHDKVGAQIARRVCERLRFSNEETDAIVELVAEHMKFMVVREMRESRLKRLLRSPLINEHLELHRADCLASHGDLSSYYFCKEKLASLKAEEIRPPRLLTGHDLIDMGYKPGPRFREMLERIEDAQLEGEISSREEAIRLVRREFPQRAAASED